MALYLYRCETCGREYEVLSGKENAPNICSCEGVVRLVLCPPNIHWKYTRQGGR